MLNYASINDPILEFPIYFQKEHTSGILKAVCKLKVLK